MAQDIEEFLRMAAARKKQQGQPNQQPSQQPSAQAPSTPPPLAPSSLAPPTSEPEVYILDEAHVDPYEQQQHQRLQPSIHTTVSTDDIVEHTSHLGERVHNRQEAVESRVTQKFDHDLGSLQKEEIVAPEVIDHGKGLEHKPNISTVLQMIRNPNSLKQAIILKEIFDRPKF